VVGLDGLVMDVGQIPQKVLQDRIRVYMGWVEPLTSNLIFFTGKRQDKVLVIIDVDLLPQMLITVESLTLEMLVKSQILT